MMSTRHSALLALLLPLLAAGCNTSTPPPSEEKVEPQAPPTPTAARTDFPSLKGRYKLNVVCDTSAQLTIKSVEVTDKNTVIELSFRNAFIKDASPTDSIRTAAPGKSTAFYIDDPESTKEYKLLSVKGIELEPKFTKIKEGDTLNFTLTFERIPDSLIKFNLIEGKTKSVGTDNQPLDTWTFMNVELKK